MKLTIAFILLFIAGFVTAQRFKLEIEIDSAANHKIKLANYYVGNIYLKDSIMLDSQGKGFFAGDTLLPQGLYKIYLDDKNHFDFLIGADQTFSLTRSTFSSPDLKIKGSLESEEFEKYTHFLKELQTRGADLNKQLENATPDKKKAISAEIATLTTELHDYWFRIQKAFPGSFLSAFILANYVPSLDIAKLPIEVQQNDSLLLLAKFYYQQKHFWEFYDYTDERLMYTPFFKPKLETWFSKALYQNYDSVKAPVFKLIEEVRPQKRIFQFVCSWFLNASIQSNILGMDALFVDIARTYYLSGDAFWTTDESLKKIRENVMFFEHNLVGMTAPDLTLETFDGEYINLHKIKSKYTVVLIYEPNCSHCQQFVPSFYNEVYLPFKDKGLEVFAIYSMDKKDEWAAFLDKHKLFKWINVWDERHISQFKILYDGRITPGVYVLDENKKIVLKKITVEQLRAFMGNELN